MPYASLDKSTVRDPAAKFERTVWTLAPVSSNPSAIVVFLDAEFYIERSAAPEVVRRLRDHHVIPDACAHFVSNNGQPSRQKDFACDSDYARFIAGDLVAWARQSHPSAAEIILVGLSLSGLSAAYIGSRYPHTFRAVIAQSGSFWWERCRFADDLIPAAGPRQEYWLSVGSAETGVNVWHGRNNHFQEISQIAGCIAAANALRVKGYSVSYREYDGGHDFDCWREDLAIALPWVWRREAGK